MTSLFFCVSLLLSDLAFLEKWRKILDPMTLSKGPLRFLLAALLEHYETYGTLMDYVSYRYWVDGAIEDDDLNDEYLQMYVDITSAYAITDTSIGPAWKAAEEWIQDHHVGMALDRAREALVAGDREGAFEAMLGVGEVTGEVEPEPPVDLSTEQLGDMLKQRPNRDDAIPTGIEVLDEAWEGGIYPGNLALAAGDTNIGKSMLLAYLAVAAYMGNKRVLYFTYELTKLQVAERVLTGLFSCSNKALNPDTIVDDLIQFREKNNLTTGSLVIDDGTNIRTVADLHRRLQMEHIDIVLLDSADDLLPSRKFDKMYEGYKEIYRDLRINICQGLNLPVWTSVQLNREAVEKSRVNLRHIGDAFAKAQRAHIVLGMSQTVGELRDPRGPMIKMHILKDTQHGSKGSHSVQKTTFGRGSDGFPGFVHQPGFEEGQV